MKQTKNTPTTTPTSLQNTCTRNIEKTPHTIRCINFFSTFGDSKYDSPTTSKNPSPKHRMENHNTQPWQKKKLA
jgi:hypothetical protein